MSVSLAAGGHGYWKMSWLFRSRLSPVAPPSGRLPTSPGRAPPRPRAPPLLQTPLGNLPSLRGLACVKSRAGRLICGASPQVPLPSAPPPPTPPAKELELSRGRGRATPIPLPPALSAFRFSCTFYYFTLLPPRTRGPGIGPSGIRDPGSRAGMGARGTCPRSAGVCREVQQPLPRICKFQRSSWGAKGEAVGVPANDLKCKTRQRFAVLNGISGTHFSGYFPGFPCNLFVWFLRCKEVFNLWYEFQWEVFLNATHASFKFKILLNNVHVT